MGVNKTIHDLAINASQRARNRYRLMVITTMHRAQLDWSLFELASKLELSPSRLRPYVLDMEREELLKPVAKSQRSRLVSTELWELTESGLELSRRLLTTAASEQSYFYGARSNTRRPLVPANGRCFELGELQDLVGGPVEKVSTTDGSWWFNEEARLYVEYGADEKEMPENHIATRYAGFVVYGNAIFIHTTHLQEGCGDE
jgi:hypothetical protein